MKMNKNRFVLIVALLCFGFAIADAKIPHTVQAHIKQRHWYNASQGSRTSHFNRSMTMKKLDGIARKTIKSGSVRPSKHGNGRRTYQYRFKKPVGVSTQGKKTKTVRVVTERNGRIVTAFPV